MTFPRPVPLIGDATSAAQRADAPEAWAFPTDTRDGLYDVMAARRDIRRYRPDPIGDDVLHRLLSAGHQARHLRLYLDLKCRLLQRALRILGGCFRSPMATSSSRRPMRPTGLMTIKECAAKS